jgi:methionine biosynthesis protein MetW
MSTFKERFYSKGYYKGLAPEPRFEEVAKIFAELRGKRLLDVGCGDGDITLLLRKKIGAKEAYGVELAQEAVMAAKEKGILAYQLDIDESEFPFDNEFFDVIYCGEIIEHLFNPDHLLKEVFRVLKKGGRCVITTPNLAGWPNRLALLFGYQPYPTAASPYNESVGKFLIKESEGQWGHIRVMTLKALKELVGLYGFNVERIIGCTVTVKTALPKVISKLITLTDGFLSNFPSLATRIIMILKKE